MILKINLFFEVIFPYTTVILNIKFCFIFLSIELFSLFSATFSTGQRALARPWFSTHCGRCLSISASPMAAWRSYVLLEHHDPRRDHNYGVRSLFPDWKFLLPPSEEGASDGNEVFHFLKRIFWSFNFFNCFKLYLLIIWYF